MYTETIKTAMMFFPFIALLISVPFILREYHNYGSISFMRFLIIYSFAFYLLCAYFLIILPLPSISDVASLDIPRTQLIPFKFIYDLVFDTSFNIKKLMNLSSFYVPLFNILLTIPFGMYLRYFFKYDLKKTILASFLLSMFFELTQLSGLYFIYPRNYRLFDVDDLIINTNNILPNILPNLLGCFILPILVVIVKNINGTIITNNKFKNKSPKGLSTLVLSPKITPTIPPIIIAPSRIIVDL